MNGRDHLRALVEAAPTDAVLTVPASWLREALEGTEAAVPVPAAQDMTAVEFGLLFGRSASTVRLWCEEGRVAGAFKLRGKQWRIPAAAAQSFRQQQGAPPTTAPRPTTGNLDDWRRRPKPAA